jgi:hypothetical protein
MCQKRLLWKPLPTSSPSTGPVFAAKTTLPFGHPDDIKICLNDWPYERFAEEITHLIVWLKVRIPAERDQEGPTAWAKERIERWIDDVFVKRLALEKDGEEWGNAEKRVMWFKNWGELQSVPGLEHIHVLVRGVPTRILAEWTGGETSPVR